MGPGFPCDRVDELIVPAGEHHLMTGLRRQFDESRADALTASGHEKARYRHEMFLRSDGRWTMDDGRWTMDDEANAASFRLPS